MGSQWSGFLGFEVAMGIFLRSEVSMGIFMRSEVAMGRVFGV